MSIRVQSAVKTGCGVPARCLEHSRAAIRRDAPRPGHPLHRLPAPERLGAVLTHWITPKQGEIRGPADSHVADEVSIRSPYRSKGRSGGEPLMLSSRPPIRQNYLFQSAPLTEARGDTWNGRRTTRHEIVSIRSPYRSKGRCIANHAIRSPYRSDPAPTYGAYEFQSAPLTEARGDVTADPSAPLTARPITFQSAPLTEARGAVPLEKTDLSFNPLPLPKQGEIPACGMFQSAPLTQVHGSGNVSIRSPYRSKGRCRNVGRLEHQIFGVSIRSPYRSKGRFGPCSDLVLRDLSFNPLPLPKQGEIPARVSIRRSDILGCRFNPLPLPKQGER